MRINVRDLEREKNYPFTLTLCFSWAYIQKILKITLDLLLFIDNITAREYWSFENTQIKYEKLENTCLL